VAAIQLRLRVCHPASPGHAGTPPPSPPPDSVIGMVAGVQWLHSVLCPFSAHIMKILGLILAVDRKDLTTVRRNKDTVETLDLQPFKILCSPHVVAHFIHSTLLYRQSAVALAEPATFSPLLDSQ